MLLSTGTTVTRESEEQGAVVHFIFFVFQIEEVGGSSSFQGQIVALWASLIVWVTQRSPDLKFMRETLPNQSESKYWHESHDAATCSSWLLLLSDSWTPPILLSAGWGLTSQPGPNFPSWYFLKVKVSWDWDAVVASWGGYITIFSPFAGTCINNTSVMMFKKGSFEIGGTIYPVTIKVSKSRGGDPAVFFLVSAGS